MHAINDFVDERQKSWCVYCGDWIEGLETNRDHVPSKALLRKPFPENLPVIKACTECNTGFSADEEYLFLFLNCVQSGSSDPEGQVDPRAGRALKRHKTLRQRIERSKTEYRTVGGDVRCAWKPEAGRMERVILKNARGHVYYEFGEPMLTAPNFVRLWPLLAMSKSEREEFEAIDANDLLSEVGSRMMVRSVSRQDLSNGWVTVQENVYRYSVTQRESVLVRLVLFEYLAAEVYWGMNTSENDESQHEGMPDSDHFQYELKFLTDS